jgi:hypothetical protein
VLMIKYGFCISVVRIQLAAPTSDNLLKSHIIAFDVHFCVTGCSGVETTHFFFPFLFLLSCGAWFGLGLAFRRLIRGWFMIILYSLLIRPVPLEHDALSCSYFGYVPFGWCDTNEIVEFFRPVNRQSFDC